MKHKIKPGAVDINGLRPEMAIAFTLACFVYMQNKAICRLTCGTDSVHGRASKHYTGLAIDLGLKHATNEAFDKDLREKITEDLKEALGTQFDVVLESNHIHVEFDPKVHVS